MAPSRDLEQHDSHRLRPVDNQDSVLVRCSNNCGFFGSRRTNNLCSVCYNQSLPSSDALPSAAVPARPRAVSLFDQFPPASTLVNRPASAIQASPIADTPALPSRRPFDFSVPPESVSNGRVVFGSGGQVVFGGSGQSPSPWRFSREPIFFTSFGSGNVLPPSSTDPQVHESPGLSPHPSSCPVPETPLSASVSPVPDPEPSIPFAVPEPSQGGSAAKRNRCHSCRKRLSLGLAFKCRCGDIFCSSHRFPDQHGCTLDVKARQREAIARGNPLIKVDNLQGRI